MKNIIPTLLLVIICTDVFAYSKYWVKFTDKNGTPYSTSNPSAFLSPQSIQRRTNQGIAVTWYDLPVNPSYINQVLATGAVTFNYSSRWLNAISITTTDAAALTAISGLSFVISTSPVQRFENPVSGREKPNDEEIFSNENLREGAPQQVVLNYNYGISYNQVHQINVDCMHSAGYNGAGVVIAVLDDGFMNVNTIGAFDSLRTDNRILGTYDFVAGVTNVYGVGGHGTMCLSDMAANIPGQMIGTAPKASYYLLRTEEAATEYIIEEDNWVAGAEYADSVGANIISTSLYYTQFDDASQNHTYADMNGRTSACAIAAVFTARVGMLTFACAGNSGTSAWYYVGTPADADSILAVGAVDASGTLANFSSRGPSSDGRIKPDISACGVNAIVVNTSGNVTAASGTSFATPLSAGGAACLWQANPSYTNMQLRHAIQMSSSQWAAPDNNKGYGIPDYCLSNIILNANTNETEENIFSIYPNPNNGEMIFSLANSTEHGVIEIYDATGKLVQTINVNAGEKNIPVNEEGLGEGIYFVRVKNGETILLSQRFAIVK